MIRSDSRIESDISVFNAQKKIKCRMGASVAENVRNLIQEILRKQRAEITNSLEELL